MLDKEKKNYKFLRTIYISVNNKYLQVIADYIDHV